MTATAIAVSGLVKTFGPTRALDGLDLTVNTGEVHGFLVSQPPTLEELFLRHYEAATPGGNGQATPEGARR